MPSRTRWLRSRPCSPRLMRRCLSPAQQRWSSDRPPLSLWTRCRRRCRRRRRSAIGTRRRRLRIGRVVSGVSLVPLPCCWLNGGNWAGDDLRRCSIGGYHFRRDLWGCAEQFRGWQPRDEDDELRAQLSEAIDDPAGHEEDEDEEDDAVENAGLRTFELADDRPVDLERPIRQPLDENAADGGAEDRGDTADDESGDEFDRPLQPERVRTDGGRCKREATASDRRDQRAGR